MRRAEGQEPGVGRKMASAPRRGGAEMSAKPIVKIGVLVHDVARMRTTIFDQAVQGMGITCAQWWALANLCRHKTDGMTQSDLARILGVGKSATGVMLDRLTEKGMVERRSPTDDRRVNNIYITDHGYDLIHHMSPIAASLNRLFLDGIDIEDIKVAETVLWKLHENLKALCDAGGSVQAKVAAMRYNAR